MQPTLDLHPLVDIACLHEVAACTTDPNDRRSMLPRSKARFVFNFLSLLLIGFGEIQKLSASET
jgi:hypothetical protein